MSIGEAARFLGGKQGFRNSPRQFFRTLVWLRRRSKRIFGVEGVVRGEDGPRPTDEIWEAGKELGLQPRTLQNARKMLDIRSVRAWDGAKQLTYWLLPGQKLPDSIPAEEPSALATGSRTRLWMSLTNGLAESNDGGRRWTFARIINPEGWSTTLDVLDADHAWLLAAGAGLWRTTDGIHWHTIGPLNTQ